MDKLYYEKNSHCGDCHWGNQELMTIVNEIGLYSLISMTTRKAEARAFMRWLNKVLIPSILEQGGYIIREKIEKELENEKAIRRLIIELVLKNEM